MRVIAQDHDWFVLEVEPDVGRVFDLPRRRLFAPMSLVAIMARGTWRDFVGDPEYVFDALSDAEDVPSDQLSLTREGFSEWDLALGAGTACGVVALARPDPALATDYAPAGEDDIDSRWSSTLVSIVRAIGQLGATLGERLHRSHSSSLR